MPQGPWSRREHERLVNLRSRGWSLAKIAAELRRPISSCCKRLSGGDTAGYKTTAEDRKTILELIRKGWTDAAVASAMGWHRRTVYNVRAAAGFRRRPGRYTAEDCARVAELASRGLWAAEIARQSGYGRKGVVLMAKRLGVVLPLKPLPADLAEPQPDPSLPSADELWPLLLGRRRFEDAPEARLGGRRMARPPIDTGRGRSSMAWPT